MPEKILIVDDDNAMLVFTRHALRNIGCHVVVMDDPVAALEYLRREKVAVLVTDNNMPVMQGLELIEKANVVSSETVKIIMSAFTDLPMALYAINQCQVYKFVPKPWGEKDMFDTVADALRRYHTLRILRHENEDVLRSLAQTIELKDPCTRGHCDRVAHLAVQIAKLLDLSGDMQREIKYGSWLHDCGKIGVPEKVLNATRKLEADEYELIKNHPGWGADVARKANLSPVIINVILCHHEHFDGTGYPNGLCGEEIPIEARVVSVADVFDALSSDRPYRKGLPRNEALEILVSMKSKELDPALVDLFLNSQAFMIIEDEQHNGGEIMTEIQNGVNKLTISGDFSIVGMNDQLSILVQHLAGLAEAVPDACNPGLPYEIDLRGVQDLDTCGCQLLVLLFRNLRHRGVKMISLKLSDDHRNKIHSLGFADEIFTGDCA
jgi:response regulator RpfG family c-di-GMP phosphodiesterase